MYRERPSLVDGAVVWTHGAMPEGEGRVLPDGCMDLLLWDGELVIAGPDTQAHLFTWRAGSRITGLRFAPGTGPLVFGLPAYELRDQRVPLAAVWPESAVRVLGERVAEAPAAGRALEAVAAERLAGQSAGGPVGQGPSPIAPVARLLARGRSVGEAARTVGLSERQLHRRCLDAFGYGPKTLARVLRTQEAVRLAARGVPLAQVAVSAGYADQAHLSREVRALAGVPLGKLLAEGAGGAGDDPDAGGAGDAPDARDVRGIPDAQGSGAKRSTPLPSGSATIA